jgi:hypothetical protein
MLLVGVTQNEMRTSTRPVVDKANVHRRRVEFPTRTLYSDVSLERRKQPGFRARLPSKIDFSFLTPRPWQAGPPSNP